MATFEPKGGHFSFTDSRTVRTESHAIRHIRPADAIDAPSLKPFLRHGLRTFLRRVAFLGTRVAEAQRTSRVRVARLEALLPRGQPHRSPTRRNPPCVPEEAPDDCAE